MEHGTCMQKTRVFYATDGLRDKQTEALADNCGRYLLYSFPEESNGKKRNEQKC